MKRLVFCNQKIHSFASKAFQKAELADRANLPKSTNLILLTISLLGLCIFQLNSFAAYLNSYGNLINNTISSLVYAPNGWFQTAAFFILGLSILALAVLLQLKAPVKLNLGAVILALIGFAFFLIGTFPARFPGEPFLAGIHKWATIFVVVFLPIAGLLVAPTFKTWNYRFLYKYTIIASTLQLLLVFAGGLLLLLHFEIFGLFERVLLLNGQIWLTVIGLNFLFAETKYDFPVISRDRLVTKPAIYCLLYTYASILLPISLSVVKTIL